MKYSSKNIGFSWFEYIYENIFLIYNIAYI